MKEILLERRGRIAVLTLCRPEHGNRLTAALAREVVESARQALLAALATADRT